MSLSIPTTPEDLSPKWLTQALRSSPEEVQGWYQQWWPAFVAKVSHRLPAGVIAIGEQMLHRVAHLIEVLVERVCAATLDLGVAAFLE